MATPGRRLDEITISRLRRLRQHGLSLRVIAADLRISTRTVQRYLKIFGKTDLQSTALIS